VSRPAPRVVTVAHCVTTVAHRLALALAVAGSLLAAGCGDGETPPTTAGAFGARTPANVSGLIPMVDVAAAGAAPQAFIVDTGSPVTLLNATSFGHAQDYQAHGPVDLTAFGVSFQQVSSITIGAFPPDACGTSETAGILGGDLLHFYQLTIDYLGAAAFLWNGVHASPDIGQDVAPALAVPFRLLGGGHASVSGITLDLPATRVIVDGTLEGYSRTFLVDSGASLVTLSTNTFETLDHTDRPRIADIPIQTIYGTQMGFITRLGTLTVGDATATSVPAVVVPDATLFTQIGAEVDENIALFVGGTFLRHFQTTFRYGDRTLDLAPYQNPVHINKLEFVSPGFDLATSCDGALFVGKVYPGSDAEAQGVRPGTPLVAIDGQLVADLGLDEATRLLHAYEPGAQVEFSLQGMVVYKVTLTYADLLPPYGG
jgi:hypothetical protein